MTDAIIHRPDFGARPRPLTIPTHDRPSDIARMRAQIERLRDTARNATERADEARLTQTPFWQGQAATGYRRAELMTEAADELERRVAELLAGYGPGPEAA